MFNSRDMGYLEKLIIGIFATLLNSPVENQNDLELDFKVFFYVDSCC